LKSKGSIQQTQRKKEGGSGKI